MIIVLLAPLPLVEVVYFLLCIVKFSFMLDSRRSSHDNLGAVEPLMLPFLLGRGKGLATRSGEHVQEHSGVTLHEGFD